MLKTRASPFLQLKRHFSLDGRNKLSNKFIPVTKDKNSDLSSHSTLLKAGFVRQSGAGIYSLLPLGLRTINKIESIIDEEMQAIGGEKLALPLMLNPEGWKKTGRWNGAKGEFFKLKDRKEVDLLLAPTHEEEITQLVASELRSAKQLPIRLYQIGKKYRDELRPRAGLLRGREFIMKDLYSFDATQEEAYTTYDQVGQAYQNIFKRIGVPFVVAEADSGNIGGSKSHEYHLISTVGEDTLLTCSGCGYTANEELAVGQLNNTQVHVDIPSTSNQAALLFKNQPNFDSTVVTFDTLDKEEGRVKGLAAVLTPSGRSPNLLKVQTKLSDYLKGKEQMSEKATMDMSEIPHTTLQKMDPTQIDHLHVFMDDAVAISLESNTVMTVHTHEHYRLAKAGDHCASCQHELTSVKAIECGHTFYLGTKYSQVLDCQFKDVNGTRKPAEMGCYGIGVTRLLAAVAEAKLDDRGICWPTSLAPYRICIVPTDDRKEEFRNLANQVYDQLSRTYPNDVVIDDRRSGFGAKMKDAELVGYPFTVIIGPKTLENGQLEIHERVQGEQSKKKTVLLDELAL